MVDIKAVMSANPGVRYILGRLEEAGYTAHLVGGAVRNVLLDHPVKDYDISTNAHPDAVTSVFQKLDHSVHPTGIDHGTVTVVLQDEPYEITTWRRDVATDGRRATIAFADHIEDDAHRRDFTVNALYANRDGDILDPTGEGLQDAANRRIRFIGDAHRRIREDALRILRYFRFTATFSGVADTDSYDYEACCYLAHHVDGLSRERIGDEMRRILSFPTSSATLSAMDEAGVLQRALPDFLITGKALLPRLEEQERALGLEPCHLRRLALLCDAPPKQELRLTGAEVKTLQALTAAANSDMAPAELGYRFPLDQALSALALKGAKAAVEYGSDSVEQMAFGSSQTFPIKAVDLMPRGFKGPALGEQLRELERRWIASGFQTSKQHLLAVA